MLKQRGIIHPLLLIIAVVLLVLVVGIVYINYQVRIDPKYNNCEPGDGFCEAIQKYRKTTKKIDSQEKTSNQPQGLYPITNDIDSELDMPFKLYILKKVAGQVDLKELSKTDSDPKHSRGVTTAKGEEIINLKEGYRAIYFSSTGYPFAKMHVDKSMDENGEFDLDAGIAIDEIKYMFREHKDLLISSSYKGYGYYLGESPAKSGKILGTGLIIFPKDRIIVTIYFFVPEPKAEDYGISNIEEFRKLQEDFIYEIIDSVKEVG